MFEEILLKLIFYVLPLVALAISRELAIGFVAYKFGDLTPKNEGRLSFNPIVHIDLLGTIIVPLVFLIFEMPILFAYAKPMSVNMNTIRDNKGYKGCIALSFSGIAFNIILAFILIIFVKITSSFIMPILLVLILNVIIISILLGVIYLIPIPPLDGGKILSYIGLAYNSTFFAIIYNKLESFGWVIIYMIFVSPLNKVITDASQAVFFLLSSIVGLQIG